MHIQPRPLTMPKKNASKADMVRKAPPRAINADPVTTAAIRSPYTLRPWAFTLLGLSPTAFKATPIGVRSVTNQTKITNAKASHVSAVC